MSDRKSPVREYRTIVEDSNDPGYVNRIAIGTATTGLVRVEWVRGRYGQVIPVNWAQAVLEEYLNGYYPLRYQVADAQNLIVRHAIEKDFEWLLLWEHDVIPPPDAMMRIDEYMRGEKVPVVSGLYYTRSSPSIPLVFRGRGTSYYDDFKLGDKVWCDGVPTGFLLIHMSILRLLWNDSPEYKAKDKIVRRVFETPRKVWYSPETHHYNTLSGTSDLLWCKRVIEGEYFKKAGWTNYQRKKYPFLVDTNLFCRHINPDGEQFP